MKKKMLAHFGAAALAILPATIITCTCGAAAPRVSSPANSSTTSESVGGVGGSGGVCGGSANSTNAGYQPTIEQLKNFTYSVPRLSNGYDLCTLRDGWNREPGDASTAFVQAAIGDLNGDGLPDAAVDLDTSGGGSGVFGTLLVLINDGHKLVQLDGINYPLGDREPVESIKITGGKIHLTKLERNESVSMATTPMLKKQITIGITHLPELHLISQCCSSAASDSASAFTKPCADIDDYLIKLSKNINDDWQSEKKTALESNKTETEMSGVIHQVAPGPRMKVPPLPAKPTVISLTLRPSAARDHVRNQVLRQSCGNDYWDGFASGILTTISDLDNMPEFTPELPNTIKIECTFHCDSVTIKRLIEPALSAGEATSISNQGCTREQQNDLLEKAKNFPYAVFPKDNAYEVLPLKDGTYKDDGLSAKAGEIAVGDLNGDGLPDVCAQVSMTHTTFDKNTSTINFLVPLLNTGSGLTQAGSDSYAFECAGLPATVDDCKQVSAVKVNSLKIENGRIIAISTGRAAGVEQENERKAELILAMEPQLTYNCSGGGSPNGLSGPGTTASALDKSLTAVWQDKIAAGGDGNNNPAKSAPGPLMVRALYDCERRMIALTQIISGSGNSDFDRTAMKALLSWPLQGRGEDQEPADAFLTFDVTFHGDGNHVAIKPAATKLGF